jgi:hypothetical protein
MHHSGRLVLVKTTLVAMPVYTAISLDLPDWLHKAFEKVMKEFLWSDSSVVQGGGKCLVAWSRVQRSAARSESTGCGFSARMERGPGHRCWCRKMQ